MSDKHYDARGNRTKRYGAGDEVLTSVPLYLLALLYAAPASYSVYHVLLYKRDPRSAMGWIIACIFLPFAGPVAYYLFGINRVRNRALGIRRKFLSIAYEARVPVAALLSPDVPGIEQIGTRITGRALLAGNTVCVLHNGEQAYPAMLASIRAARQRVFLATYILKVDHTGRAFADALAETGLESEVLAITNDPAESATIMEDYYTANPDVDLWLTLGPNGANPFYSFMKNAGLQAGDIYHATFDLGPEIAEKIKDGTTLLATDQQPYVQGYLVVQWLTWIKRYGIYPPTEVTATGPGITDKDNIDLIAKFAGTYR